REVHRAGVAEAPERDAHVRRGDGLRSEAVDVELEDGGGTGGSARGQHRRDTKDLLHDSRSSFSRVSGQPVVTTRGTRRVGANTEGVSDLSCDPRPMKLYTVGGEPQDRRPRSGGFSRIRTWVIGPEIPRS